MTSTLTDLIDTFQSSGSAGRIGHFFFFFLLHCASCGILVPQPGIEPVPLALEEQSLNHWTTREVPELDTFDSSVFKHYLLSASPSSQLSLSSSFSPLSDPSQPFAVPSPLTPLQSPYDFDFWFLHRKPG